MGIKISMQREVKERIRKEIIEAAQQYAEEYEYEIENYTDTASALNCVYAEFKDQFDWKIKQIGEYNAFIEWLKGLPMFFVYSYDDERMRIQKWFNQSNEEASKYSDEQVNKLYWNLLAREFFALVKKFNVSGIIKSEDDTKVTPYDMDDYLDNDNALEESTIVSNTGPEDIEDYYIPIEYECVEDEDSDSDETRPYVDYFKYRIYLDEVMRLNPPEVIDGIEYHGYMGISNTMSYMIHIDPSGDAVIVRESGADKLYNPNKKEIAVEESNMIDNDKRNPKIIKENPDGSGQNENVVYEYDQLYEKFNDCVKALFFACNLIHNFSREYDKESDCCNCICKNCVIYKALDKAGAIKNDFDKMIIGSNWEPDEDYALYDYLEKLDRERKIRGLTKKEKREEAKEYLPELLSYPTYFDINEKQELKETVRDNGYTIIYSLVENNRELYRATIDWSKSVIKIELFGNNPKTFVLTGDEADDLIDAFYDIMEEKEYMMAEAIADVFHSKGYFK